MSSDTQESHRKYWTVYQCRPNEKPLSGNTPDSPENSESPDSKLYEPSEPPEQFATGLPVPHNFGFGSDDDTESSLNWLDLAEDTLPGLLHPEEDLFRRVDALVVSSRRQIIDSWTKKY